MIRLLQSLICAAVLCTSLSTSAFLTNIKGGGVQSVALDEVCADADLALSLIASTRKFNDAGAIFVDQACLFGEQVCWSGENRRSVLTAFGFLTGAYIDVQLNVHRTSVFFPKYDSSTMALDGIDKSGTPCDELGDNVVCMLPKAVEKSESVNAFYVIGGLDAQIPNRGAVCMVLPGAVGEDAVNVQCLNKSFGGTIVPASGAVDEDADKFYLFAPQSNEVTIHRFSITSSTITDDSLLQATTISGNVTSRSIMMAIDYEDTLYFFGSVASADIYSIDIGLGSTGSLFVASHGVGSTEALYFDNIGDALYVCGLTQIEKYDTAGTLLATSAGFACQDVQVDLVTGKVYGVDNNGVLRRFDPDDLSTEESLTLQGSGDNLRGLEVDGANRRLYALNVSGSSDSRTFYKVSTCTS